MVSPYMIVHTSIHNWSPVNTCALLHCLNFFCNFMVNRAVYPMALFWLQIWVATQNQATTNKKHPVCF